MWRALREQRTLDFGSEKLDTFAETSEKHSQVNLNFGEIPYRSTTTGLLLRCTQPTPRMCDANIFVSGRPVSTCPFKVTELLSPRNRTRSPIDYFMASASCVTLMRELALTVGMIVRWSTVSLFGPSTSASTKRFVFGVEAMYHTNHPVPFANCCFRGQALPYTHKQDTDTYTNTNYYPAGPQNVFELSFRRSEESLV